jgi:hypothetical protein
VRIRVASAGVGFLGMATSLGVGMPSRDAHRLARCDPLHTSAQGGDSARCGSEGPLGGRGSNPHRPKPAVFLRSLGRFSDQLWMAAVIAHGLLRRRWDEPRRFEDAVGYLPGAEGQEAAGGLQWSDPSPATELALGVPSLTYELPAVTPTCGGPPGDRPPFTSESSNWRRIGRPTPSTGNVQTGSRRQHRAQRPLLGGLGCLTRTRAGVTLHRICAIGKPGSIGRMA